MPLDPRMRDSIATTLTDIACEAGDILRRHHGGDCPHVLKPDGTPSSEADIESEKLILDALKRHYPTIPVVSEESTYDIPPSDLFFLVDPLDGTRDFLAGNPDYSVNICLIEGNRPVASAVAAPGIGRVWGAGVTAFEAAIHRGRPTTRFAIRVRKGPEDGLVALVSRRHGDTETEACLAGLPIGQRRGVASALKFCLIASGEADIYVRCGPTMEWDTAAGDHVLTSAGGCVIVPSGREITYGHYRIFYRNGPFAALGDPSYTSRLGLPNRGPTLTPIRPACSPETTPPPV